MIARHTMGCDGFLGSLNPRNNGCMRCGKSKEAHSTIAHVRRRSLDVEREITREAGRGYIDPTAIITHAETRASRLHAEHVTNPMLVAADRDWLQEAKEELADTRNYLAWWIEENPDDDLRRQHTFASLRHVLMAYDLLLEHE